MEMGFSAPGSADGTSFVSADQTEKLVRAFGSNYHISGTTGDEAPEMVLDEDLLLVLPDSEMCGASGSDHIPPRHECLLHLSLT